jgi:hypothetical protein
VGVSPYFDIDKRRTKSKFTFVLVLSAVKENLFTGAVYLLDIFFLTGTVQVINILHSSEY